MEAGNRLEFESIDLIVRKHSLYCILAIHNEHVMTGNGLSETQKYSPLVFVHLYILACQG